MMQALVITGPKQRDLADLTWVRRPTPRPRPDEVLIATKAVGLNPVDEKLVASGHMAWTFPHTLGLDVAGVVIAVGERVNEFQPGQRVCGHGNLAVDGSFAEAVTLPVGAVAEIPPKLSFETAAGSLCAGLTAYQALFRKANLNAVETVLVHAGAGGVGSMAIQLAKSVGKTVWTTVSADKQAFVTRCHPDMQIDYRREDVTARIGELSQQRGVDLIINTIGSPTADLPRLAYNGQLVCVLETPTGPIPAQPALSISNLDLGGAHRSHNPQQVADLGRMTRALLALEDQGQVDPLISEILTPDQIPAGLQRLRQHAVVGKLVATFN